MAWTNIFDLADWDVYIQYNGNTETPNPDSRNALVLASELDPVVGTVTIENGAIICNLQNMSGTGDPIPAPEIVVVPAGTPPPSAPARVSAFDVSEGNPLEGTFQGTSFTSVEEVNEIGAGTYSVTYGGLSTDIAEQTPVTNIELADDLPSGQGLSFSIYYGGF